VSLAKYRSKRRFDHTPEPAGRDRSRGGPLRFVVQKHRARQLHYDFRLELDGVLKSWAVPKGPSLDPGEKRLAMQVEDHPFDYRTFEGIIPPGNYGAGTVMVWDEGTYEAPGTSSRAECEAALRRDLAEGHLHLVLHGHKLQGGFSLVKLRSGEANAWLLMKKRDSFASSADVREQDRSVISGRSLEEIAQGARARGEVWLSNGREEPIAPEDAPQAKMPHRIIPMLATPVEEPFDRPGWLFEVKWDGFRAIAEVERRGVRLYSRNHISLKERFLPVVQALEQLGHEVVLDGEVVVVDEQGRAQFQLLQNYQTTRQGRLVYYVFDLLYVDGHDLRGLPLRRRKELLGQVLKGARDIRLSEHIEEKGIAFFRAATAQGLEGIIAKDAASRYREGVRAREWQKLKTRLRQEAVIGGFTEPRGSRPNLGALVLGLYEGDRLVYVGHSGSGFDATSLAEVWSRLKPLERATCPFDKRPATNAPAHWVEPQLVCEVEFQKWTADGYMREPIFLGLRDDKDPHAVRRERPESARKPASRGRKPPEGGQAPPPGANAPGSPHSAHAPPPGADAPGSPGPAHAPGANAPGSPPLTNPDKIYWPAEGYTKRDLVAYYRHVAPFALPYLRDRPESLNRHPNGIEGKSFFQKDVSERPPPPWVETVRLSSSHRGAITYIVCQNENTLLYLANLGCIELNPWNSRMQTPDQPDYLIIDLDPVETPFRQVVEAAQAVRKTLEQAGAACYCKTSGKRGLHVYVPLGARYQYEHARQFAELIANLVHRQLPESTSVLRDPARRQKRVYLDFLQNARGQTLAAPYSVRPVPGATVSTPLRWREVTPRLDPTRFTIRTMARRLERVGDLWQGVLGSGIDIQQVLERLARR
jgi:bifunctional non-homologous end joining protein LigD